MLRRSTTLLLITPDTLARVDLDGGRSCSVKRSWQRPRFESNSIATLVDAAWRLGPRRSGKVWVLSTDFWTGVVSLPAGTSATLSEDDLQQALSLEAESFSGLSAFDSVIGSVAIEPDIAGDHRWWVTQVPNSEFSQVESTLNALSAQFAGVSHPALPFGGSNQAGSAFQIQSWGESTVAFALQHHKASAASFDSGSMGAYAGGDRPVKTGSGVASAPIHDCMVLGGRLDSPHVKNELQHWLERNSGNEGEAPAVQWLTDRPMLIAQKRSSDALLQLEREQDLHAWAMQWCDANQSLARLPSVAAPKRPMSKEARTAIAVSLALVTIAGCWGHRLLQTRMLRDVEQKIARLDKQKKEVDDAKKQLATLQDGIKKRDTESAQLEARVAVQRSNLDAAKKHYDAMRKRCLLLVEALGTAAEKESWIQRIETSADQITLHGAAVSGNAASRLAARLEQELLSSGWIVRPAEATLAADSDLFEFHIRLLPVKQPKAEVVPVQTTPEMGRRRRA